MLYEKPFTRAIRPAPRKRSRMEQTKAAAKQKAGLLGEKPGFLRAIRPAPRKRSRMAQTKAAAKQKAGLRGEEPGFSRAIRPAPRKRSRMAQTKESHPAGSAKAESDGADKGESDYLKVE
jgi:hypothetical protein